MSEFEYIEKFLLCSEFKLFLLILNSIYPSMIDFYCHDERREIYDFSKNFFMRILTGNKQVLCCSINPIIFQLKLKQC